MPASNAGARPKVFWWVMIFGTILVLYLGWPFRWSNIPTATIPITGSEPTGIPVTPTAETLVSPTPAPLVDVIVKAENANAFDSFDIRDVVIRVSDSSEADSGADGQLRVHCALEQSIWAWAPGYGISSVKCDGQKTSYELTLTHLAAVDNSNYLWLPAVRECNNCHGNQLQNVADASYDEVNEWFRSGHGKVFDGKYFESMYTGSSATGKMSQPAEPVIIDNEWVPVPAEKSNDYHGPGFQLDFPGQTGNCAYCHVPASLTFTQESMDLSPFFSQMGGAWAEGVTCDVCHKVFDVILDDRNFPFTNRPGILSYQFLRPNTGVFMTGPFSNILTKRKNENESIVMLNHHSTCSPLFSRSEFCAPCHFGKFGDMVIYNSYGEWRQSSFAANPEAAGYRTCQDCHMSHMDLRDGASLPSERQACSADNRKFQNFDHNMMDFGPDSEHGKEIEIPRMVKGAARLDVTFGSEGAGPNTLDVNVTVTNIKAGHKFPTDSPLRHLILVVEAEDRVNTPLIHVGGDRIPNWAGPGPLSPLGVVGTMNELGISDYSGLPGKIFANLMVEEGTNLSPAMAYWNEMKYTFVDSADGRNSDTRLVPAKPDSSTYSFTMPDVGDVEITVRLIYRYAFYDLVIWKEWFDKRRADIVVIEWKCEGPPTQPEELGKSCKPIEPPTP